MPLSPEYGLARVTVREPMSDADAGGASVERLPGDLGQLFMVEQEAEVAHGLGDRAASAPGRALSRVQLRSSPSRSSTAR